MKVKIDFKSFLQKGVENVDDDFFITLITGYQGSGKSYLAVKIVHEQENAKRTIRTNIHSYKDVGRSIEYFDNLDDIFDDDDDYITYVVDELSKKYTKDSRQDLRFYSWLQQSRKHKRHVILITQEYSQVPIWLRGIANTVYTTSKVHFLPIYKSSLGVPVLNENFEWSIHEFFVLYYKRTKAISSLYDTFESITKL